MLDNMQDKTFLLICSVRYCLSRQQSYALGWIDKLLKRHWSEIPRNDKRVILNDIKNYLKNKEVTTLERMVWQEILDLGLKDGLIIKEKRR